MNWLTRVNPWRRIAQLERENVRLRWEVDGLNAALQHSCDNYDRIRETNLRLREALGLYRSG